MSAPNVVLVGRPNVGKSTLSNRITGRRRAIVAPVAGTTRDRVSTPATFQDREFSLVDTGGLFGATTDPLHAHVIEHGLKALETADVVIFVVDAQDGLVPGDEEIAHRLHALDRPVIVAINKTDDKRAQARAIEFHQLGFDALLEISAEHGTGVFELLEAVTATFRKADQTVVASGFSRTDSDADATTDAEDREPDETSVAIVGRPNVGKSSLVNRLVKEDRVMVNELPGTTRDSVDVMLTWHKRQIRLVDTAGMRRPGRVAESGTVESVSVLQAKRAISRADVCVLVIDATEGAGDREGAIGGEAEAAGCGIVLAVNKWDLVRGQGQPFVEALDDRLRFQLKFLEYAPIVHISALTGEHTGRLLEVVDRIATARRKRVTTSELNKFLEEVTEANPPTSKTRHEVRILYGAQTATAPPTFVLFTNVATELHFSYMRFLTNQLRETFGFEGTPIRVKVRKRKR